MRDGPRSRRARTGSKSPRAVGAHAVGLAGPAQGAYRRGARSDASLERQIRSASAQSCCRLMAYNLLAPATSQMSSTIALLAGYLAFAPTAAFAYAFLW